MAREVEVQKRLRHPFICQLYGYAVLENELMLLCEYCPGGDLSSYAKYLRENTSEGIQEPLVCSWMAQLLMALDYCHKHRVLHRDIKTKNIFVASNATLRLGDFGISTVLASTNDAAATRIGTPHFLSPEACLGTKYSWPSDIWSLGVVFFELLTGFVPFHDATDLEDLTHKILHEQIPSLPNVYSEDVRSLVVEMLSKEPKKRPRSKMILKRRCMQVALRDLMRLDDPADDLSKRCLHDGSGPARTHEATPKVVPNRSVEPRK